MNYKKCIFRKLFTNIVLILLNYKNYTPIRGTNNIFICQQKVIMFMNYKLFWLFRYFVCLCDFYVSILTLNLSIKSIPVYELQKKIYFVNCLQHILFSLLNYRNYSLFCLIKGTNKNNYQ